MSFIPKSLDEIVGVNDVKHFLQQIINTEKELKNVYFYGPPGTGKTSTIQCFINQMKDKIDYYMFNLSYKNGVDFVRDDIINICKKKSNKEYKFIVLDEFDSLSKEGQTYISYCIREYPKVKFCFISNTINEVIHYILESSILFYFDSHQKKDFVNLIHRICETNNITLDDSQIENICCISNYDMRKICKLISLDTEGLNIDLDPNLLLYDVPTISKKLYEYLNNGIDYFTIYKFYREYVVDKITWRESLNVDEIDVKLFDNINYSYVLPSLLNSILDLKNIYLVFFKKKQKKSQ